MSNVSVTIALQGLSPLEVKELQQALASAGAEASTVRTASEDSETGASKHYEPFTMLAVIAVSQVALTGLAIYLAKGRSRSTTRERLVIRLLDGTTISHEVETENASEQQISEELMRKLAELKVPIPRTTGAEV